MPDSPPLIFEKRLGMLSAVNSAAREAMSAIDGRVVLKITRANRNQRRRSLYWCVCATVTEVLNDLHDMSLTEQDVHDLTRRKLGYCTEHALPSGDVFVKLKSTSDKAMTEPERAEFTSRAFALWSRWTGVDVDTLTREGANA